MTRLLTRRRFVSGAALAAPVAVAGCKPFGEGSFFADHVLTLGERLSYRVNRTFGRHALAREYAPEDISPVFRANGNQGPEAAAYVQHAATGFRDWTLKVEGLVARPQRFSLADLRAMPARTQITRHDCVEGWSCIGQWTGVPLGTVLQAAGLRDNARFIVFHCADDLWGMRYYESIDLVDAFHPQTILAYAMNGADLPQPHGAPLRLRVERQLGYKHAKFVMAIEAVESFSSLYEGKGGFWEDLMGYEWFAGI